MHCAAEGAPARVDLWPRLPHVVIRICQRLPGDNGPVPQKGAAPAAAQALVEDVDEVGEHAGSLEGDEGERG